MAGRNGERHIPLSLCCLGPCFESLSFLVVIYGVVNIILGGCGGYYHTIVGCEVRGYAKPTTPHSLDNQFVRNFVRNITVMGALFVCPCLFFFFFFFSTNTRKQDHITFFVISKAIISSQTWTAALIMFCIVYRAIDSCVLFFRICRTIQIGWRASIRHVKPLVSFNSFEHYVFLLLWIVPHLRHTALMLAR